MMKPCHHGDGKAERHRNTPEFGEEGPPDCNMFNHMSPLKGHGSTDASQHADVEGDAAKPIGNPCHAIEQPWKKRVVHMRNDGEGSELCQEAVASLMTLRNGV